ncbi:hypothetical protein VNO77_22870 [Canavalia gladiata]|uniref:Uncharacterized protein n=1 Tax=Canavalia gladiata TaxID=3824 RepID=A0AAN9L4V3_CANGL
MHEGVSVFGGSLLEGSPKNKKGKSQVLGWELLGRRPREEESGDSRPPDPVVFSSPHFVVYKPCVRRREDTRKVCILCFNLNRSRVMLSIIRFERNPGRVAIRKLKRHERQKQYGCVL